MKLATIAIRVFCVYMFSGEEDFDHHVYSSVNKVKKVLAKPATDAKDTTLNSSEYGKYKYESKRLLTVYVYIASTMQHIKLRLSFCIIAWGIIML